VRYVIYIYIYDVSRLRVNINNGRLAEQFWRLRTCLELTEKTERETSFVFLQSGFLEAFFAALTI
jgi:hypothetical protein